MTTRAVTFRGRRGDGVAVTGRAVVDDLSAWVRQRYDHGWRVLAVFEVDAPDQVGGIVRAADGTPRTWWAET